MTIIREKQWKWTCKALRFDWFARCRFDIVDYYLNTQLILLNCVCVQNDLSSANGCNKTKRSAHNSVVNFNYCPLFFVSGCARSINTQHDKIIAKQKIINVHLKTATNTEQNVWNCDERALRRNSIQMHIWSKTISRNFHSFTLVGRLVIVDSRADIFYGSAN